MMGFFSPPIELWKNTIAEKELTALVENTLLSGEKRKQRISGIFGLNGFRSNREGCTETGIGLRCFARVCSGNPRIADLLKVSLALRVPLDFLVYENPKLKG